MYSTTRRQVALRDIALMVMMFSIPWLSPLPVSAGELTEIDAKELSPSFSLADISGQTRSLKEFEGKVVLVNFWASWCTPCIQELPGIQRLATAMRDQPFGVIGVNVGEAERRVIATAGRYEMDFPVLLDTDSAVFRDWGATVLPTTYVLDRNGRVRYIERGPLEWDRVDIIEILKGLAEEQAWSVKD